MIKVKTVVDFDLDGEDHSEGLRQQQRKRISRE
jgi:hypothetical protein